MPTGSEEYTSGFSKRIINGNRTSPKIAVHSSWFPEVSSSDKSERCKDEKAWCLISRHGLVHCVVRARNIGDQYAAQAMYSC